VPLQSTTRAYLEDFVKVTPTKLTGDIETGEKSIAKLTPVKKKQAEQDTSNKSSAANQSSKSKPSSQGTAQSGGQVQQTKQKNSSGDNEQEITEVQPKIPLDDIVDLRNDIMRMTKHSGAESGAANSEGLLKKTDKLLKKHSVEMIEPGVGDRVDPVQHSVVSTRASETPAGKIVEVINAGYRVDGEVRKEAQVITSEG
jgi:molecular chaperone GrpE (heat shock protein)